MTKILFVVTIHWTILKFCGYPLSIVQDDKFCSFGTSCEDVANNISELCLRDINSPRLWVHGVFWSTFSCNFFKVTWCSGDVRACRKRLSGKTFLEVSPCLWIRGFLPLIHDQGSKRLCWCSYPRHAWIRFFNLNHVAGTAPNGIST